jgi:hypothetical protein
LDDESGTDSSDLDEGETKEADEVKENVEQASEKDAQEETTEKAEEEVEEATNKETEIEEEAMKWAEGNIKEWNTEFLLWDR